MGSRQDVSTTDTWSAEATTGGPVVAGACVTGGTARPRPGVAHGTGRGGAVGEADIAHGQDVVRPGPEGPAAKEDHELSSISVR